jgi:hypothetical protein
MSTKISVKPVTNISVEIITCLLKEESFSFSRSSSREMPVINVKYAGKSGIIHGEKKDKRPAPKAADRLIDCSNMILLENLKFYFLLKSAV